MALVFSMDAGAEGTYERVMELYKTNITEYGRCLKNEVKASRMGVILNKDGQDLFNWSVNYLI